MGEGRAGHLQAAHPKARRAGMGVEVGDQAQLEARGEGEVGVVEVWGVERPAGLAVGGWGEGAEVGVGAAWAGAAEGERAESGAGG